MNLKFEIDGRLLKQKKAHHHQNKDLDNLFCSFVFTTPEWKHIEKYAIFWNRKGKSMIHSLGRGIKTQCPVPQMVLNDLYFYVQVYANDKVFTRKEKIFTHGDVQISKDEEKSKKDIKDFFKQMGDKIDNIIYDDNKLLIYKNNKLVKTIDIIDEGLLVKIFNEEVPKYIVDTALSADSELPIANKAVYEALNKKLDKSSLATVAITGDYNDLQNLPTEFPPEEHTHQVKDITDFNEPIDEDLNDFLDKLIEEL